MTKKMIVTILVIMGMVAWGTASADEFSLRGPRGFGPSFSPGTGSDAFINGNRPGMPGTEAHPGSRPPHRKNAGSLLGKYMHDNMLTEAISEITGQPVETVSEAMNEQRPGAFLETYEIDPEVFRAVMDAKTVSLAEKAAECGLITQEQLSDIIEKMEEHAAMHETEIESGD